MTDLALIASFVVWYPNDIQIVVLQIACNILPLQHSTWWQNVGRADLVSTFIFQLTEYPCNNTYDMFFLIYHEYFRTKKDIPRVFLKHECIFRG